MNQLDKPETDKAPINQFNEQASEKSSANNVMNKRALIMIISVLVVLLLSYAGYYFIKTNISDNNNTPDAHLYQDVLAAHLKVNNLNSPVAKTKHSDQTKPANQTKKSNKTKQTNQTQPINKTSKLATATKKLKNNKNTTKISALATKINTADQSNPANDYPNNPESPHQSNQDAHQRRNQESPNQINQKNNQKHNQAQIEGLHKNTQTSLNSLLESQKKSRDTQARHTDKIVFKVDEGQQNTQRSLGQLKHSIEQFIDKINALLKQQANKQAKPMLAQQTNTAVFELVDISLWDSKPQATIQYQGKMSIVDKGSVRVGWKIVNIDFDKEQISIVHAKNGQQITLKRIR